MKTDILIIGAGLAGLRLAELCEAQGQKVVIVEKQSHIGGKIRTDKVNGYMLDHGFQVLLPHYPAAKRCFDYDSLELCYFDRAATLVTDTDTWCMSSPFHHPIKTAQNFGKVCGFYRDIFKMSKDLLSQKSLDPIK